MLIKLIRIQKNYLHYCSLFSRFVVQLWTVRLCLSCFAVWVNTTHTYEFLFHVIIFYLVYCMCVASLMLGVFLFFFVQFFVIFLFFLHQVQPRTHQQTTREISFLVRGARVLSLRSLALLAPCLSLALAHLWSLASLSLRCFKILILYSSSLFSKLSLHKLSIFFFFSPPFLRVSTVLTKTSITLRKFTKNSTAVLWVHVCQTIGSSTN